MKAWLSLSEQPLDGELLTRFVYIDEAGISQHEPIAVVAGVIVHADKQLVELERRLERAVNKHVPEDLREGFILHASEIFNGGKRLPRDRWPHQNGWDLANDLADIPVRMKLPLVFGIVEKSKWPNVFSVEHLSVADRSIHLHVTAYMSAALQVDKWMRKYHPNEVTMMIAEDNQQARSLIKAMQNEHRNPSLVNELDEKTRQYFPFRKIKHSPLFEEKSGSPALQMADFCAYIMKRHLMGKARYGALIEKISPLYVVHSLDETKSS